VATQLASSLCVARTVVLYGGTGLENVVGLCILVRLWRLCPRTARPAHASPSTLTRARARPSPRRARPTAQQHGLAHPVVKSRHMDSPNQIVPNSSDNSVIVIPQFEYEFIQK